MALTPYYQDDAVTIYHGDCREVMAQLPDLSVDLVLTDPPYSSGARRDAERQMRGSMTRALEDEDWFSHDSMTTWGFTWFLRSVFIDIRRIIAPGSHVYVFSDWRQQPNVYALLESSGYRVNHSLVWDKTYFGMGAHWRNQHEHIVFASAGPPNAMLDKGQGSVLSVPKVSAAARVHPTEKPQALLKKIVRAIPGDLLFDPFLGSGGTLRVAKDEGRRGVGIEIDERNCEVAARLLTPPAVKQAELPSFDPEPSEQEGLPWERA